jgi:exodeoxyribonuclease VII large subunit
MQPLLASLFDETERRPVTVSELTASIRGELEKRFASVWVEGEISNFHTHGSGHWYFTLKDEFAQMRAACYRSSNQRIRFRPEDGLLVRARGRVSVYEVKGEYQFIVEALEPVGAGALQLAFEQTKARLQAEGLFAAELKRAIPFFPRRVGVVTSPTGAAIRDIINVISRRTRSVHVLFTPARVQGENAAHEIVRAIKFLNDHHARALSDGSHDRRVDVIIVGRGGGSIEDLWAFNEEAVARAIRNSAIPVISAVGHETDFTIADFAADLRAPTPSAAAELVAAHEEQLRSQLDSLHRNLARSVRFRLNAERSRVQQLAYSRGFDEVRGRLHTAMTVADDAEHRLLTSIAVALQSALRRLDAAAHALTPSHLRERVATGRARFDALCHARDAALTARMERAGQQFSLAAAALDAMSPLKVLERGYAIAQDANGGVVREAKTVSTGDALRLRLWKGTLDCRVEGVTEPGADRGPRAGSPRGVVDATGSGNQPE